MTYLRLYNEFTPIYRYSNEKKTSNHHRFFPVIVKEPYRRFSGKLRPYLAMAKVRLCDWRAPLAGLEASLCDYRAQLPGMGADV